MFIQKTYGKKNKYAIIIQHDSDFVNTLFLNFYHFFKIYEYYSKIRAYDILIPCKTMHENLHNHQGTANWLLYSFS